jgi:hypothetical protein
MLTSLPTRSIARAINLPTTLSSFAEMVATCSISALVVIIFALFFNSATTLVTAALMPRCRSIGLMPAHARHCADTQPLADLRQLLSIPP